MQKQNKKKIKVKWMLLGLYNAQDEAVKSS